MRRQIQVGFDDTVGDADDAPRLSIVIHVSWSDGFPSDLVDRGLLTATDRARVQLGLLTGQPSEDHI